MVNSHQQTRTTTVEANPASGDERIIHELRHNFGRALDIDAQHLRARLDQLETDNASLRQHNQQLQQAVDLLRHIASDHERQLKELRDFFSPAVTRQSQVGPHKE